VRRTIVVFATPRVQIISETGTNRTNRAALMMSVVRARTIRSIGDAVEVDDKAIRIIGSKDVLQAVIAGKQNANGDVRGFVRNWRAIQNKTANSYVIEIAM
jgi:hypothetical protein